MPQPLAVPVLILTDPAGLMGTRYLNIETAVIGRSLSKIGLPAADQT